MPYYARTKGRTQEIPPDGTRSPFLGSGVRSPLPPRTPLSKSAEHPLLPSSVRYLFEMPSSPPTRSLHFTSCDETRRISSHVVPFADQGGTLFKDERPQSRSLPDLSADVRVALQAPKHDDVTYRHGFWTRCRCCRAGRDPLSLLRRVVLVPLADALQFLEGVAESIPPVVPALLAVLFLLVALPLMIAWDVV